MSSRSHVDGVVGRSRRPLLVVGVVAALLLAFFVVRSARDDEEAAAPPTPTTTPATTTTLRPATAEDPLRILVAGDSLVGWVPEGLNGALDGEPVEVIDAWKGSSGLARPDYYDWPAEMARLVDEHDPDVIVVGFGGNDTQSLVVGDRVIERGEPEWEEEYARRVDQVLDAAEGTGRTLWWIGLPLSDRDNVEELRPAIIGAVTAELESRPWAHFVDASKILSPDGVYRVTLTGPDGEEVRVRADDGIHLSPTGGRMVVDSFLDEVRAERGLH